MGTHKKRRMTKASIEKAFHVLGIEDTEIRARFICALVGHSLIQSLFWGQWSCGRCNALLGDTWTGCYPAAQIAVIIGHDCPKCRENYAKLTWRDKWYAPDPFEKEDDEEEGKVKEKKDE